MKKLTKRVQAGGLWFDVPVNINYVAVSHTGDVYCYQRKPIQPVYNWNRSMYHPCGSVSLEGADWRECCWYVGDQVGGEDAERREWMARGVELAINKLKGLGDKSYSPYELECLSNSIRAGEVE